MQADSSDMNPNSTTLELQINNYTYLSDTSQLAILGYIATPTVTSRPNATRSRKKSWDPMDSLNDGYHYMRDPEDRVMYIGDTKQGYVLWDDMAKVRWHGGQTDEEVGYTKVIKSVAPIDSDVEESLLGIREDYGLAHAIFGEENCVKQRVIFSIQNPNGHQPHRISWYAIDIILLSLKVTKMYESHVYRQVSNEWLWVTPDATRDVSSHCPDHRRERGGDASPRHSCHVYETDDQRPPRSGR